MKTILIISAILLFGCGRKLSSREKFVDYINDPKNNITQQIEIGGVQATVKWLPEEYRQIKDSMTEKDPYCYFDVRFDKVRGEKPSKEKLLYLNFDMQQDFTLFSKGDSIAPVICQRIENGTPGSYQYMVAFEKQDLENKGFALFYKDKIFSIGTLAFVYNDQDIKKIPKLN